MEAKFQSISIPEFQERFDTPDKCFQHLVDLKWKEGFNCPKCKGQKYCKAIRPYDRQCTRCRYIQSPTSGTLFHKLKFPLDKAFLAVYLVSTNKKGISSTELSRKTGLNQKTAWLFRIKILQAMESSDRHPLEGQVEMKRITMKKILLDKKGNKKLVPKHVILSIEKKSNGVARIYSKLVVKNSNLEFQQFVKKKISGDAHIKSCRYCYSNLSNLQNIYQIACPEVTGKKESAVMKRVSHRLDAWLVGIHGQVEHLQYYLNEYCYRHNRHRMKGEIFDDLLSRMVKHEPRPYLTLIA